ncbi:PREDICTED: protein lethal(2)essential for life-like [Dufourea novaeangliae]|uniref:Protein lethal(2)essential for life n=1 Tax=Dufourea novaeangliae TaxID=178035 RepID=A0A154PDS5_DUFNO|nr:PREDICTED: protein lethal(2)essential for life-like [Dufourea novaeangliae]KZC10003.1 Protein lethal(2)essential for life [Dufourea novaeangliae]
MRSRMTVIPKLFSHWWETLERSHRLLDQRFGKGLNPQDFPPSFFDRSPSRFLPYNYYRPWWDRFEEEEESGWSIIKDDKDKFRVVLDIQQFKPEEVNVKVVDNFIVVEGKHEEKEDDHGVISRHFIRKYLVPDQCDPEKASSVLSSDGILTITAPRRPETLEAKQEKTIKIEHTGKPAEETQKAKQSQ